MGYDISQGAKDHYDEFTLGFQFAAETLHIQGCGIFRILKGHSALSRLAEETCT